MEDGDRNVTIVVVIFIFITLAVFGIIGVMYFIGGVKMVSSWFN